MQKSQRRKTARTRTQLLLGLQSLTDPSVSEYISKLRAAYGKYSLPIEEVRRTVDESMGKTTLSEIVRQMREESF